MILAIIQTLNYCEFNLNVGKFPRNTNKLESVISFAYEILLTIIIIK